MAKAATKVHTVESILAECTKEVRKGLGRKRATQAAKDYWIDNSRKSIATQLASGGDWDKDRKRALPVARKMGKVAAVLAGKGLVLLWAAEAAADAAQADPGCPGPAGGGGYCDF